MSARFYAKSEVDVPMYPGVRVWTANISGDRLRVGIEIPSEDGSDMAGTFVEVTRLIGESFLAAADVYEATQASNTGSEPK